MTGTHAMAFPIRIFDGFCCEVSVGHRGEPGERVSGYRSWREDGTLRRQVWDGEKQEWQEVTEWK